MKLNLSVFNATAGFAIAAFAIAQSSSLAGTITASSPSRDHVAAAISAARSGDTVKIPAGRATWKSGVSIPEGKQIVLQGAGIGSTVITQETTTCISLQSARITGISFMMRSGDQAILAQGQGWRVDHCEFRSLTSSRVLSLKAQADPHPWGVMDNNVHFNARILVTAPYSWRGQNESWAAPTALGSIETVVVEDSTFDVNYMGNQIDANYGGHFVFRYNYVTNSQVQAHAVQGNNRGSRKWEVYGNTFVGNNSSWAWTPMFLRAGTGVIWSNRIVGHYTQPRIVFDVRRGAEGPKGAGGKADGSSQWDGNTTNGIPGATGTHTGSTSATTLVDSTKNWTPGMFELKRTVNGVTHNYNRWIYNVTDGSRAQIVANTATTITVAALKGGKDNRWENGDRYFITGGYPARDQIGAGQDQYLWTTYWEGTAPPQAIEPVYIWGNEGFEGVVVSNGEQCKFLIQEGRDYILGQPKPGYKPLAYPHPLRTDAPSTGVVPPRNLKIVTAQN